MTIFIRKPAKQTCGSKLDSMCGSKTLTMQKYISNSLSAAIHRNKRNAAGLSEKVVHLCVRRQTNIVQSVTRTATKVTAGVIRKLPYTHQVGNTHIPAKNAKLRMDNNRVFSNLSIKSDFPSGRLITSKGKV